jgi:hypothetical protein
VVRDLVQSGPGGCLANFCRVGIQQNQCDNVAIGANYEVDFEGSQPFEISALVLANLARPGEAEAKARDELYQSLLSWLIRDRCGRDPEWCEKPQRIIPVYMCRSERLIERDMRTFWRCLRDRLIAAYMVVAFLKEAESGVVPKLPNGMKRLSINEIATSVASDIGMVDAGNVETRVWRPSLPVIHLCAAWAVCVQECKRERGLDLMTNIAFMDEQFLRLLLERAELYEPLLERSRLKIKPEKLTRFRIARNRVQ